MYNEGVRAFTCGEDLEARRRVRISAGTTTTPPQIVYADAGEDFIGVTEVAAGSGNTVSVKLNNSPGTFEIECSASSAIARGTVIYGDADGRVSDASSGTAQGIALEAGVTYQHIEVALWNVKSTTAATVSIADASGHTTKTTVEAALEEIYNHIESPHSTILVPLGSLTLEGGSALAQFADSATGTLPGFAQISNKELVLQWNNNSAASGASGFQKVAFSVPLPQNLNASADVEIHIWAKLSGANDSPDLVTECFFDAGDTDCAGTDPSASGGTTLTEHICTIAGTNVSTPPATLTVIFGPQDAELDDDDLLVYGVWLEYTGRLSV